MDIAKLIETGRNLFKLLTGRAGEGYVPPGSVLVPAGPGASASQPVVPGPAATSGPPMPRADMALTANFGLWELTKTNNAALQAKNRILTDAQVRKLKEVAELMEKVRTIIGGAVDVHSGYRSPDLNAATKGAAPKSQHMLCEACDWSPAGPDTEASIEAAFQKVLAAAKRGEIKFGQLIVEQAQRGYSKSIWVHVSIGRPYRAADRCGEVMRMVEKDGKAVYTLIERLPA